ncbi:hypothetical protein AAZX31_02G006000 [Glycine max]|uniref:Histidine-rich glycoprotein n=1 Tax=Glycine soja TaxID=3848 RepID=A0A445LHS8_GLYSO|nr:hypothetical protein JHK86_002829 [Glycine max]RZC22796.1 hypothetical protein D0Y65_002589 [Glycine soja]
MSSKYIFMCLLVILGMVLFATTSLADHHLLSTAESPMSEVVHRYSYDDHDYNSNHYYDHYHNHNHHHHHHHNHHHDFDDHDHNCGDDNKDHNDNHGYDHQIQNPHDGKHWPSTTQNEPSKVENKKPQEEHS